MNNPVVPLSSSAQPSPRGPGMRTPAEFEARVAQWARSQPDVHALILFGSRVRTDRPADEYSDWDYHLYTNDVARYSSLDWLAEIAPVWSAHAEVSERGSWKIGVLFEGGFEAEFVPLSSRTMRLIFAAMAHPGWRWLYPRKLIQGIHLTRLVLRSTCQLRHGGPEWERRLRSIQAPWGRSEGALISQAVFTDTIASYWKHAVWAYKKIMRGEVRAAYLCLGSVLAPLTWKLLVNETLILRAEDSDASASRPERWLSPERLAQTLAFSGTDRQMLARALLQDMALFEDAVRSVAKTHGHTAPDRTAVAAYLRAGLSPVARGQERQVSA